jgi:recombination protein RecT
MNPAPIGPAEVQQLSPPPAKRQPIEIVKDGLEARSAQLASVIPDGISQERLRYVCLQALKKNPDLLKCRPDTIISSIVQAFELGLEPNTPRKLAYLIPYKDECQFQPSYVGLIALARRSREIAKFTVRAVYHADIFGVRYGTDEGITHEMATTNRGPLVAVYSVVTFANGMNDFEVMLLDDIEQVKAASKASKGPWDDWEGEMAKKAVIKRHCKRLPMDDLAAKAIEIDNAIDFTDYQTADTVASIAANTANNAKPLLERLSAAKTLPSEALEATKGIA